MNPRTVAFSHDLLFDDDENNGGESFVDVVFLFVSYLSPSIFKELLFKECYNFCVLSLFSVLNAFKMSRSLSSVVIVTIQEVSVQSDLQLLERDVQ